MILRADRYSWGVASSRGVALGLGSVRLAVLGLGLVAAAVGLAVGVPVIVALAAPVAAGVYVWLPGGAGRTCHDTVRVAAGHGIRRQNGTARSAAGVGAVPSTGRSGRPWWPKELGGLDIKRVHVDGVEFGVVMARHGAHPVATAVFSTVGPPRYRLMGSDEQASLVAGWGQVLSGLALERSRVTRVQWVERSAPAQPGAISPSARPGYRALVANLEAQAVEHQVYVAVQVRTRADQLADGPGNGVSWPPGWPARSSGARPARRAGAKPGMSSTPAAGGTGRSRWPRGPGCRSGPPGSTR